MEAMVVDWQSPYVPLVFRSFHLIDRFMSDPAVDPMVSRVAKHKLTNTHKKSCQRVLTLAYNIEVKGSESLAVGLVWSLQKPWGCTFPWLTPVIVLPVQRSCSFEGPVILPSGDPPYRGSDRVTLARLQPITIEVPLFSISRR